MILDEHGRVDAERSAEEADFRRDMERDAKAEEDAWLREGLAGMEREALIDFTANIWHSRNELIACVRKALR